MRINFNKKPRKEGAGLFTTDGTDVHIGPNLMRNSEVAEAKKKTEERSCFRACRTCGCCANSRRDATMPKEYDRYAGKMIDCRKCEPFRFHDCHNGWMRDSYGDAEAFTEQVQQMIKKTGGKPLI